MVKKCLRCGELIHAKINLKKYCFNCKQETRKKYAKKHYKLYMKTGHYSQKILSTIKENLKNKILV